MIRLTLCLSVLLALIGICSADDIPVISGVFMPTNISVNYEGAKTACSMQYSRLATMDEITTAFKKGYEFCRWGWIAEHKLVMLRLTPFLNCAGYNVGILIRDCPNIGSAFCVDGTGSIKIIPIVNRVASYENASLACSSIGTSIATKEQVEGNAGKLPNNSPGWYNWGVGEVQNGVFVSDVCHDTLSQASAFCYNPSLADVIINKDDSWKKIVMACLLAMVFVVLLFAAIFMRGNRFICCMGRQRTHPSDVPQAPMPTWNQTGIYRRISHANKGVLYDNLTNTQKRPSAIFPEMNIYNTHYTNMAFDTEE
ncbi:uncharacterized protein [Pyxicephalus adspersus]|uniref:uncharacterized protein n=1 Tax=Pyxicephalus adspersus TaxID=30357 RepID=UPI003B5A22C1